MLSERVINQFMYALISIEQEDAFIIIDTLYPGVGYKKSELLFNVFEHDTIKIKRISAYMQEAFLTFLRPLIQII